jgi:hypothetical protein
VQQLPHAPLCFVAMDENSRSTGTLSGGTDAPPPILPRVLLPAGARGVGAERASSLSRRPVVCGTHLAAMLAKRVFVVGVGMTK